MKKHKNNMDLTPGNIYYRVDVYNLNEIGICKGYFTTHFDALMQIEHDLMIENLNELKPNSQITAVLIQPSGNELNIYNQYFI